MFDEFDSKVHNIQSLLDLKVEKAEVREEIDEAVLPLSMDLNAVKAGLPQEGLVNRIQESLNDKANRNDLLKLRKQLKVLSGEENRDDPGLSKVRLK